MEEARADTAALAPRPSVSRLSSDHVNEPDFDEKNTEAPRRGRSPDRDGASGAVAVMLGFPGAVRRLLTVHRRAGIHSKIAAAGARVFYLAA